MSENSPSHDPHFQDGNMKAHQACTTCQRKKRKCDKAFPRCGLCERLGHHCNYNSQARPRSGDVSSLQRRISQLEYRFDESVMRNSGLESTNSSTGTGSRDRSMTDEERANTLSIAFLDIECFQRSRSQGMAPTIDIPMEVLTVLSGKKTIEKVTTDYFKTTHLWLPVISRKRIELGITFGTSGSDLAMLFLAMKLITSRLDQGTSYRQNSLYAVTRRFLAVLESAGTVSLLYLQAMLLVAYYEYGHAIYPAAWMTIGACSRYSELLGLPSQTDFYNTLERSTTWTEAEERRRVWWGVFILDRAISLGSQRKFSAPDPQDTDLLPVDDNAWDEGDVSNAIHRRVSTPLSIPQPSFARLCQSALLIGRASMHVSCARSSSTPPLSDAVSLTDSLNNFILLLDADTSIPAPYGYFASLAPRFLAWSGLIMILDSYACPETLQAGMNVSTRNEAQNGDEAEIQAFAVQQLRDVSEQTNYFTNELLKVITSVPDQIEQLDKVCPLLLDAIYCGMATLHFIWHESGDVAVHRRLENMKTALEQLAVRWRLGSQYLSMEKYHNVLESRQSANS